MVILMPFLQENWSIVLFCSLKIVKSPSKTSKKNFKLQKILKLESVHCNLIQNLT